MTTQEALLRLMNLPPSQFSNVCRTSDGDYLARKVGDLGYNAFLGKPSPIHEGPARRLMLKTWNSLSTKEKKAVVGLAAFPGDGVPILLAEDFGVPTDELL